MYVCMYVYIYIYIWENIDYYIYVKAAFFMAGKLTIERRFVLLYILAYHNPYITG